MPVKVTFRAWTLLIAVVCNLPSLIGCSATGGFSLVPPGEQLTHQARAVLDATPAMVPEPRELSKTVLPALYLQPGQSLLIEPLDFDAVVRIPPDQTVLPDGTVDLGKYGRVIVAGMTPEQAEALIQQRIVDAGDDPTPVNVQVIEPTVGFYVLGEVNSPGFYLLAGHETVLDAIVKAGGLTDRAASCDILLSRPTLPRSCRVVLPVCYRQITQLGDTSTNYQLKPGDRIFIPTRSTWDEFKFWEATATCPRCKCSPQRSCGCATVDTYGNPIAFLPGNTEETVVVEAVPPGPLAIP